MPFSCGIIGLPNVGKSTLFNAITRSEVAAENYPFCTIEPNKAIVPVPDARVRALATMSSSEKTLYTTIDFVDIAGLVKGASQGAGLGNRFISHIKPVNALVHVVRLFTNENIIKETPINPQEDLRTIHQELILYDMEQCEKHRKNIEKLASRQEKTAQATLAALDKVAEILDKEQLLSQAATNLSAAEKALIKPFQFVTLKPVLIIANLAENEVTTPHTKNPYYKDFVQTVTAAGFPLIELATELELELSDLDESLLEETILPYLSAVGLKQSGCARLVRKMYDILNLITFFTTGEKETRAWTVAKETLAPQAAGIIHSDIEKGFIKADIITAATLLDLGSYKKAREMGKIRLEGKDYAIQDGDVCHFKFNL